MTWDPIEYENITIWRKYEKTSKEIIKEVKTMHNEKQELEHAYDTYG